MSLRSRWRRRGISLKDISRISPGRDTDPGVRPGHFRKLSELFSKPPIGGGGNDEMAAAVAVAVVLVATAVEEVVVADT
ncbi:unnamed protein product [Merluccius merluccius]